MAWPDGKGQPYFGLKGKWLTFWITVRSVKVRVIHASLTRYVGGMRN